MEKIRQEMEKAKNPWVKRIGEHLLSREDMKKNLEKEGKTLEECFKFVLQELSKKAFKEGNVGYVAGDDEEIFGLACHYFDEDNIKVGKSNFRTNADGSATSKDLQALTGTQSKKKENAKKEKNDVKAAEKIEEKVAETVEKQKPKPKPKKKTKDKVNENQISMFDLFGDGSNV